VSWVVGLVWGVAVLIAVVVLGLCAFDVAGKAKRLSRDAARLRTLRDTLIDLQASIADARRRMPTRQGP
jgi:hypothetical protein